MSFESRTITILQVLQTTGQFQKWVLHYRSICVE